MSKHLGMDIRVPIECDNPSIQRDEEKWQGGSFDCQSADCV